MKIKVFNGKRSIRKHEAFVSYVYGHEAKRASVALGVSLFGNTFCTYDDEGSHQKDPMIESCASFVAICKYTEGL